MTWSLTVSANVLDIAGALRQAVDDQIRNGVPVERVEMAQIEAVVAAASQLASGDYLGLDAVTVKASGHMGADGTGRDATIELALTAHAGRFTPVYTSEPAPAPTILRDLEAPVPVFGDPVFAEAPLPGGEATGRTDSAAEIALAAELAAVERDRVDAEQIQARIAEQARRVEEAKANPLWATTPEGVDAPTPLDSGTTSIGPTDEALNPVAPSVTPALAARLGVGMTADLSVAPRPDAPEDVNAEVLAPPTPLATDEAPVVPLVDVDGVATPAETRDGEIVATSSLVPDETSGAVDAATAPTPDAVDPTTTSEPAPGDLPHVEAPVVVDEPAPVEVGDLVPPLDPAPEVVAEDPPAKNGRSKP